MFKSLQTKKGFSILFASLVASLVLAIGLAILRITIKQITLASAGRESQHAFYAADTGTECALYLDYNYGGEVSSDPTTSCKSRGRFFGQPGFDESGAISGIEYCDEGAGYRPAVYSCLTDSAGAPIYFTVDTEGTGDAALHNPSSAASGNSVLTKFEVTADNDKNICFDVEVLKTPETDSYGDYTGGYKTTVVSRGYSTCDKSNKNRFERAIKTTY